MSMDNMKTTTVQWDLFMASDDKQAAWRLIEPYHIYYVENVPNERIRRFLRRNKRRIAEVAGDNRLVYTDLAARSERLNAKNRRLRYNFPWVNPSLTMPTMDGVFLAHMLLDVTGPEVLRPSLLVCAKEKEYFLVEIPTDGTRLMRWWKATMPEILREVKVRREPPRPKPQPKPKAEESQSDGVMLSRSSRKDIRYSIEENSVRDYIEQIERYHGEVADTIRFRLSDTTPPAPEPKPQPAKSREEMELEQIRQSIGNLVATGYDRTLLETILKEMVGSTQPVKSELHITRELDIVLTGYNNMVIDLRPIDKAVYLTFLSEPHGINFKDITDYKEDMMNWYRRITKVNEKKAWKTVERMMDSDALSQSLWKIRQAFLLRFDDSLAQYYYISGKQGHAKGVHLPQEMIVWEEFGK